MLVLFIIQSVSIKQRITMQFAIFHKFTVYTEWPKTETNLKVYSSYIIITKEDDPYIEMCQYIIQSKTGVLNFISV